MCPPAAARALVTNFYAPSQPLTLGPPGALWTNLAPTAVALASYFCVADLVLISQCSYYNARNARRRSRSLHRRRDTDTTAVSEADEESPLIHSRRSRSGSIGLPGSHRRHSVRRRESNLDPLTRIITGEDDTPDSNPWLHNALSLVAVWVVGSAGWFVSYKMGAWDVADSVPDAGDDLTLARPEKAIGMVLGYFSALCYLWYVFLSPVSPVGGFSSRYLTNGKLSALGSLRSSRTTRKSHARALPCSSSCSR